MIPIIARYLLQVSLTIFRLVTLRSAYSSLLDAFSTCPSFSLLVSLVPSTHGFGNQRQSRCDRDAYPAQRWCCGVPMSYRP